MTGVTWARRLKRSATRCSLASPAGPLRAALPGPSAWRTARAIWTCVHEYMVFLDEERLGELEQVLQDFKTRTLQEVVYLEVQRGVDIRLI